MFLMSCGVLNVKVYIYVARSLLDRHGNWGSMLEVSGRRRDLDEPCECGGRDGERDAELEREKNDGGNGNRWRKSKKETLKFCCWGKVCNSCFFLSALFFFSETNTPALSHFPLLFPLLLLVFNKMFLLHKSSRQKINRLFVQQHKEALTHPRVFKKGLQSLENGWIRLHLLKKCFFFNETWCFFDTITHIKPKIFQY